MNPDMMNFLNQFQGGPQMQQQAPMQQQAWGGGMQPGGSDLAQQAVNQAAASGAAPQGGGGGGMSPDVLSMLAGALPAAGAGIGRGIDQLVDIWSDQRAKEGIEGADDDIAEFLRAVGSQGAVSEPVAQSAPMGPPDGMSPLEQYLMARGGM